MDTAQDTIPAGVGNDTITADEPAAVNTAPATGDWTSALIICAEKAPTIGKGVKTIAVQTRTRDKDTGAFVKRAYAKADVYLRFADPVDFGKVAASAEVLALGDELEQAGFGGFSDKPNAVCIGPAHPAYAALNLAVQRGATTVVIDGLTEDEQVLLGQWLVGVEERATVTFT